MGIVIEAEGTIKRVPVELVGRKYNVKPIKAARAIRMVKLIENLSDNEGMQVMDHLDSTIDQMFTPADAKKIRARLEDSDDLLDYDHISLLMQALLTEAGGEENPTG